MTAIAPTGYLNNTSGVSSSVLVTFRLAAPTGVIVGYGTVAGSVSVTFTPPATVAPGQTYTAKACMNAAMTTNCVSDPTFTSGGDLTGLTFVTGNAGGNYWVQVTANASPGYLVSPASSTANHAETSKVATPGTPTAATSGTTFGAIVVTFAASSGTAPSSYTATACTNQGMSNGCITANSYISGSQFTGLNSGTRYWVQVTAIGPPGYTNSVPNVSNNSARAR
jgi:hypothetical protein